MRTRFTLLVDHLHNSYWFVPGLLTVVAIVLSYVAAWGDRRIAGTDFPAWLSDLAFDGNVDGAAEILGTIATSMITVAGVVFSITIVVLTLASGQFGPRLLRTFMRDRGTQVTLGTFVGGFTYALLVLRALQFGADGAVPRLSVSLALLWALAGVGVLIHYIHHISIAIQAPELIDEISGELVATTNRLFPDEHQPGRRPRLSAERPEGPGRAVPARSDGHLEYVDRGGLVDLARREDLVIVLDTRPGRFLVLATPVAWAWPADRVDDALATEMAGKIVTGPKRSQIQDVEFPVKQLAEIAVRALSRAVNDPYTAITSIDQLSVGLCLLAGREFPDAVLADADGVVRVIISDPLTFADLVDSAFSQIRQSVTEHAAVHAAIIDALARIAACVRDPERLAPLEDQADRVWAAARRDVADERDLTALDLPTKRLRQACRAQRQGREAVLEPELPQP